MTKVIFKNRKLNTDKLLSFGFEKTDSGSVFHTDIVGGQMRLAVRADADGALWTTVVDKNNNEEYVLHLVSDAAGAFVGQVRAEYESVLEEISARCFDADVFKSRQAKEVTAYIRNTYGDDWEYLWQKFPDNAVVRRKDNQKWYAALLTVSQRKLGFDADEPVEILDLRMKPEDIARRTDHEKYFPGYHMNKKHWVTLCLNHTLPLEEICRRIDESYALARK